MRPIDVVVVSWNTREDLLRCAASVMASRGVTPRLTVVDNASLDGSARAVREAFPGVRVLENAENEGFATAVNQGLATGDAPYVLVLNPDAVLSTTALAALARRLDTLPRHGIVAPRLVWGDGSAQHSAHRFPSVGVSVLLGLGLHRLVSRGTKSRLLLEGFWESDRERDVPWVIGAAMLIRRSALDEVGALDERFFVYAEDMELCDRMWGAGWGVRFCPDVEVVHLGNRSGAQRYGEARTAVQLYNALGWLRRRRGRAWTAAYVAVNTAGVVPRWVLLSVAQRVRPRAARAQRLDMLRAHARFYLGRAANPDRGLRG